MNNQLHLYFDLVQNLTESQKFQIITLYNQKSISSKKILTILLLKLYKKTNPSSNNKLPTKLISILNNILQTKSLYKCKLFIEKLKKHRFWQQKWSQDEDNQLISIVESCKSESKNWFHISDVFNSTQIRGSYHRQTNLIKQRWENKLNPKILKTPWTQDEDELLLNFVLKHGKQWERIKRILLFHRSTDQIIERFYQLLEKSENLPKINEKIETQNFNYHHIYQPDEVEIQLIQTILQSKKSQKKIPISKKSKKISSIDPIDQIINKIKQVVTTVKQDENVNYDLIKDFFEKKGNEIDQDDEIQFGVKNGGSDEIFLFPNHQLKAMLKLLYKMREQKQQNQNVEEQNCEHQKILDQQQQQKIQQNEQQGLLSYYRRPDIHQQNQSYQQQLMLQQYLEQQQYQQQQQQFQQIYQQQNLAMLQYQEMMLNQFAVQQLFQQYQAQSIQQQFLKNQNFDESQIKKEYEK